MKKMVFIAALLGLLFCFAGCGAALRNGSPENSNETAEKNSGQAGPGAAGPYTVDTKISEVINDPVFGEYGRLLFPVNSAYYSGDTLGELRLTWYSNIDANQA